MSCISARLSQDDVTPRGQRVAFDLEEWLEGAGAAVPGQAPTGPPPACPRPGPGPGASPQ
jgi:hypothetical protein